jgi:K+-transporting ATPase ATPase C chain
MQSMPYRVGHALHALPLDETSALITGNQTMFQHIRANLLLLVATLALCSVAYPLTLWAVGQTMLHRQVEGSMIEETVKDEKGERTVVRGSSLIAQAFTGKQYFQPRPSNAGSNGFDASASGASNWAASNPLLRDRVARQLGPMVRYDKTSPTKAGKEVGPDVEEWFAKQAGDYALTWAREHPTLATQWIKDNSEAVAGFLEKDAKDVKDNASDYVSPFFEKFVSDPQNKGTWPTSVDESVEKDGKTTKKVIKGQKTGEAVQAYFFDLWLTANKGNREIVLEKVPADMVMSSGSGLDPHITLANAQYQLGGIVDEWAKQVDQTQMPRDKVEAVITQALNANKFSPGFGLLGEPMVNVLEVNLSIKKALEPLVNKTKG